MGPERETFPPDWRLTRFLLGDVTESERLEIERWCLDHDPDAFEILIAIEDELGFEYVEGRLSAAHRLLFERRYLATYSDRFKIAFARALLHRATPDPWGG